MRAKIESPRESESERGEELELSEVQGMRVMNPGIKMMSRWRFDMRTHLAVTSEKTQHEEDRMRDIHISKRGSEAASEEQSDEWRKTERLEHEAPNTLARSDPCVAPEYPVNGEMQSRPGSVFVQKSGRVDDDVRISALDAFYRKDGRRYIGEVLERNRGEDAGDLKRRELNELVENLTCLTVLEKKNLQIQSEDSGGGEEMENLEK